MREQFEKMSEIEKRLKNVSFSKLCGNYGHEAGLITENSLIDVIYVQGAWYAYQEQQKKIDEALKWLKVPHYGYTAAISSISVAVKELEK